MAKTFKVKILDGDIAASQNSWWRYYGDGAVMTMVTFELTLLFLPGFPITFNKAFS